VTEKSTTVCGVRSPELHSNAATRRCYALRIALGRRLSSATQSCRWCDRRIPRGPRLAIIEDAIEPYLHLARTAFANCMRTFDANDLYRASAISRIHIVQYLSGLEHDAPRLPSPQSATRLAGDPSGLKHAPDKERQPASVVRVCSTDRAAAPRNLVQRKACKQDIASRHSETSTPHQGVFARAPILCRSYRFEVPIRAFQQTFQCRLGRHPDERTYFYGDSTKEPSV
jgi:hypothetical protein